MADCVDAHTSPLAAVASDVISYVCQAADEEADQLAVQQLLEKHGSERAAVADLLADLGLQPLSMTLLNIQEQLERSNSNSNNAAHSAASLSSSVDVTPLYAACRAALVLVSSHGGDEEWRSCIEAYGHALPLTVVSSWTEASPLPLAVVCAQLLSVFCSLSPSLAALLCLGPVSSLRAVLQRTAQALAAAVHTASAEETAAVHDVHALVSLLSVLTQYAVTQEAEGGAEAEAEAEAEAGVAAETDLDAAAEAAVDGGSNLCPSADVIQQLASALLSCIQLGAGPLRVLGFQGLTLLHHLLHLLQQLSLSRRISQAGRSELQQAGKLLLLHIASRPVSSLMLSFLQDSAACKAVDAGGGGVGGAGAGAAAPPPLPIPPTTVLCATLSALASLIACRNPASPGALSPSAAAAADGFAPTASAAVSAASAESATTASGSSTTSSSSGGGGHFLYTTDVRIAIDMCIRECTDLPVGDASRAHWLQLLQALLCASQWGASAGSGCARYRAADVEATLTSLAQLHSTELPQHVRHSVLELLEVGKAPGGWLDSLDDL